MYKSMQELVQSEPYLKLNEYGELVIDCDDLPDSIDFHSHLSNLLSGKHNDPANKGDKLIFPTLPPIEKMDLSQPYWTAHLEDSYRGVMALPKFSISGLRILSDMIRGGTFDNCFESMDANHIQKSVILPISSAKDDRSLMAIQAARLYPDRLVPFCSIHPDDPHRNGKVNKYKSMGAKGFKLKIPDFELRHGTDALLGLMKDCYEAGLPVLFHTGATIGPKAPNISKTLKKFLRCTRTEIYGELLKQLPHDFVLIFGHSGISEYKLVAEYLAKYPLTYAEVSCQTTESIRYLINAVGSERLLFGTDWPALPQAITLSRVLAATENDIGARKNILYRNARQLLDRENVG